MVCNYSLLNNKTKTVFVNTLLSNLSKINEGSLYAFIGMSFANSIHSWAIFFLLNWKACLSVPWPKVPVIFISISLPEVHVFLNPKGYP